MNQIKLTTKLLALFFVVVYAFGFGVVDGEVTKCIEKERIALLRFKKEITDESNVLSSWGSEENKWECCKWNGIICSNRTGHVISLQLVGVYDQYGYRLLTGNISSALLELYHLARLDLSVNNFEGNEIPEFIGSFKKLKHLNLRSCLFTGNVPSQFVNLTSLRTLDLGLNDGLRIDNLKWLSRLSSLFLLDLSNVNFTQSFETVMLQYILKLPSLRELQLSGSQFSNATTYCNMFVNSTSTSLAILDLSNIGLTSFIFRWLFNTTVSLVSIDLSQNLLDGSIPDAFGNFIFLEHLDLSRNRLNGSIPDSFGKLVSLEDLNLSYNRIEGGIPKSLWNLSRLHTLVASYNHLNEPLSNSFHNLSGKAKVSLQKLDLSYNQITGSFPDLRSFSALRELHLGNNTLKGDIPSSVGHLSKLEILDVSSNFLKGTVSEAHLSKLHSLKVLDLSFNSLSTNLTNDWIPPFRLDMISLARCNTGPSFPAWLQTQSNFSRLDLSFNNISDELPKWLWDLSFGLDYLDLSHNQITGNLPNLTSNFAESSILDLSFNNFSGSVPILHPNSYISYLSNNMFVGSISFLCTTTYDFLWVLDLSNNQLSGELPNCWESMTRLSILNLAGNNFSGEIPRNLGSLPTIQRLHLRNNNLSGELPSSLKKCQNLVMMDVGGNKLTGNIPSWIGSHLTELVVLSFRDNRFHGSIPPEFCHLTHIQILDLSRNNLSGRIPDKCFSNITSLVRQPGKNINPRYFSRLEEFNHKDVYMIDDALVQWKQQEFEYGKKTLGFLTLVDLSSNRIVGNIPPEIFRMRRLVSMNLSRNHLTGSISSDIDQMKVLECLDLSRNQLSGNIPVGLAKLTFLAFLDLSNNNLSGKIPSGTQLQSFNESVYGGNTNLCGSPLPRCPPNSSSSNHGKHYQEDDFTIQSIFKEFYIPMVFGFIVGFWGIFGTLILKKSWRYAYFNFFNKITDWMYVKAAIYVASLRRRS